MLGGHQGDDVRPASSGPTEGVKLTYDDFLLFPDDGQRHELIDGEHCVSPSPNVKHQRVLGKLFGVVQSYLEEHPVGEIFCGPPDVVCLPTTSSNRICFTSRTIERLRC